MKLIPLILLSLLACRPTVHIGDGDDTANPDDGFFNNTSWRLHDEIESMVYVSWKQPASTAVHVEYSFDEGEWLSSPTRQRSAGHHTQVLVGIPYDTRTEWRVVNENGESVRGVPITTGPVPSGLPIGELTLAEPDGWLPEGRYLLTSINQDAGGWTGGNYWTFIIDRQARPVWAHLAPDEHWTLFPQVAVTRDRILWDEATYWSDWDDGGRSQVHERYLDAEIADHATPGLHHCFVQLPDTSLVWGSQDHGGGEALVEKGPGDADETVLWTCDEDWPDAGRCESNGIFYRESTDSFLYSFYTNNSLVEVDRATGRSLWWAGDVRGGYSFDPVDSTFAWQHGVSYTDAGTLLVSTKADGGRSTPVYEYNVNHEDQVLEQVWSYDSGIYAQTNGDAWRLSNGNTLHLLGSAGELLEVTPEGEEVWHVDFNAEKLLGRGEFVEDLYTLVEP